MRRVAVVPMPVLVDAYGTFGLPVVPEDLSILEAAGLANLVRQLNEFVDIALLPPLAYSLPSKDRHNNPRERGECRDSPCGGIA